MPFSCCSQNDLHKFFGLWGLSTVASSVIGPIVIQAIINESGNNWMGFPFLFALCLCSFVVILFWVDVEKGRRDAAAWAVMRNKENGKAE